MTVVIEAMASYRRDLRAAITGTLAFLDSGPYLEQIVLEHLKALLAEERKMFSSDVKSEPEPPMEKPWYPDEGEWIETHGKNPKLPKGIKIVRLIGSERNTRKYFSLPVSTNGLQGWNLYVAYKVVT